MGLINDFNHTQPENKAEATVQTVQPVALDEIKNLTREDLARSGLTPTEIRVGSKTPEQTQQTLGFKGRIPARGAYAIPYFDLDNNPIEDQGMPYQRFRLLGLEEGSTLGKYLSPKGSRSHVYIPSSFRDALKNSKVGKTLVITEGEKKATAACLAGIPCVGLPGVYNFKAKDKEQAVLSPEIAALIEQLQKKDAIDTVVVLYDSNGWPMEKASAPRNAEEFGQHGKLWSLGMGRCALNADVHHAARKLAKLIRETFVGLPVAAQWMKPDLEKCTGPRGGQYTMLRCKSRGLDDALVADQSSEVLKTIAEAASWASVAKPDADNEGFIPLGTLNQGLYVALWSNRSKNLITMPGKDLSNVSALTLMVGNSYLEKHYSKIDKQGNRSVDAQRAAREVADACSLAGHFNEADRVFGTGTWLGEDGDLVVNTADGVFRADGQCIPRIVEGRKALYIKEGPFPPPAYRATSNAEYRAVVSRIMSSLEQWNYAGGTAASAKMVLGWMTMTIFLGAMTSRPSIWLVGQRGSGKSELLRFIKSCLGGYMWHTDMASESTSAGVRQMFGRSSGPCGLDEMEKDNTDNVNARSERNTNGFLSLNRSSYSAGSDVRKGTADQVGKVFRIMTSFCFASIADPALEPADLTRIAKIYLKPLQHDGHIGKPPAKLSAEDAAVFFWGTIQRWQSYQSLFAEVREHWLSYAGNGESREVDTFGVLMAAAMTAVDQNVSNVCTTMGQALPDLMGQLQEAREASKESDLILDTIAAMTIEVLRPETDERGNSRINRDKMSVGRAMQTEVVRLTKSPNSTMVSEEAQALGNIGIRLLENAGKLYAAIVARHAGLSDLLKNTRWRKDGAWTGGLRDVDGAIRNHPVRVSGMLRKCTLVPVAALRLDIPDTLFSGDDAATTNNVVPLIAKGEAKKPEEPTPPAPKHAPPTVVVNDPTTPLLDQLTKIIEVSYVDLDA